MPIFKNDIVYSLIGKRQEEIKDLKVLEDFVQYILERMKNSEDSLPSKLNKQYNVPIVFNNKVKLNKIIFTCDIIRGVSVFQNLI